MPLYKRKPVALVEPPTDLRPNEEVFQVSYTKEIFQNYSDYLKRVRLYKRRDWTCKATGKSGLTYQEALESEKKAAEKIQTIPEDFVGPVLREIQYSMLPLRDLARSIVEKFQEPLSEGDVVQGRRNGRLYPCQIVKILEDHYKIAWLGSNNTVTTQATLNGEELVGKKLPFTQGVLQCFIKESTYRNCPWVLHNDLASKHGIGTDLPVALRSKVCVQDGVVVNCGKRKRSEDKANSSEMENGEGSGKSEAQVIKYPIDDLLVEPCEEDKHLMARPSPKRDFNVPMECVGDLLTVWDFCSSFGRVLSLSPFSLEDFENALCHKDSTPSLILEACCSLLVFLMKHAEGKFFEAMSEKNKKFTKIGNFKITAITWTEYLCDFVESCCPIKLSAHISMIKRGHYSLLDIQVKLAIFRELVHEALDTDAFHEKLDKDIEIRQALTATRRDEALEKGRKTREEKKRKKGEEANGNANADADAKENGEECGDESEEDGDVSEGSGKRLVACKNQSARNEKNQEEDGEADKNGAKKKIDAARMALKLKKEEIKEVLASKTAEQRKEYLEREIEKRFIRTSPLGQDRNFNKYWFFRREGRLFVESAVEGSDSSEWGYYETKDEVDALVGSLNTKGERERDLKKQLEKHYNRICSELQKRAKEAARTSSMEEGGEVLVRRSTRVRAAPKENPAQAFLKYVNKWKEA